MPSNEEKVPRSQEFNAVPVFADIRAPDYLAMLVPIEAAAAELARAKRYQHRPK